MFYLLLDVKQKLILNKQMLTLGSYCEELRGSRRQHEVAAGAGFNHSIVSFLESDKNIRFSTLQAVAKKGLKVNDHQWNNIKLLWLEQQSGEKFRPNDWRDSARELQLRERSATDEFTDAAVEKLKSNIDVIAKNRLQTVIIEVLGNPKLLVALKSFREVFRDLEPKSKES